MTSDTGNAAHSSVAPIQAEIIQSLGVADGFDAYRELAHRSQFLADYLQASGLRHFVVGISGGIDSLVAGLLARSAISMLHERGHVNAGLIAARLPYGKQMDADDAIECMDLLEPEQMLTVDIKPAADMLMQGLTQQGIRLADAAERDVVLGNIKARQRMVALYAVAGARAGLVVGTDHAAEDLVGYSTKFGDAAADVMPLRGLNKRRVRALARLLDAPDSLVDKVPTADLESLNPLRPDEEAFGVSYEEIDDFLEGKAVSAAAGQRLLQLWRAGAHKRAPAASPATLIYT
ncbi:MAG TPA: ammonia-dependent NAD(+) synthetase [Burkholderiaceae bacterium]|nr:ammonia-dependent NAD(+) synthetase [Burkholderiaceae bacterium]